MYCTFFFFNDTAPTEIYPLSLHDALPIYLAMPDALRAAALREVFEEVGLLFARAAGDQSAERPLAGDADCRRLRAAMEDGAGLDRKSTRLNSSHLVISYAVFCLKKKNRRH